MMRIGITTQYTNTCNYGGCLQAYALCTTLNNRGYDAVQIKYSSNNISIKKKKRDIIKRLIHIKSLINRICGKIYNSNQEIAKRQKAFIEFRDNISHTDITYTDTTLYTCNSFDLYITGSDQIWNLSTLQNFCDFYWLNFVPQGKKKISYAAGIDTSNIQEEFYPRVKDLLSDYSAISVREKQGKNLIDKILGKDMAQWVLDPTLILNREDWEKICEDNLFNSKRYVFAYLLGDNMQQRRLVTEWAKKNNRIIINIPYLLNQFRSCDKNFGDIKKSDISPNLWLSLIRDADCVFTDSFHACVFSEIFHTPFFVFKRSKDLLKNSMNSRIYSLMDLFDTEDRIVEDNADIESLPALESIDFERADERVAVERENSLHFLLSSIEG